MARKPEVFVRALTMEEGRRLQRITRSAKDPVKLRRAIVVLMSVRDHVVDAGQRRLRAPGGARVQRAGV